MTINIQSLVWNSNDIEIGGIQKFTIFVSGKTDDGKSMTVRIEDFCPYFYINIPDSFQKRNIDKLFELIKSKLDYVKVDEDGNAKYNDQKYGYSLLKYDLVLKKKLYPFLNNKQFKCMRLIFNTNGAFKKALNFFKYPLYCPGVPRTTFEVFDGSVEHINRFCHIQNISPCSWITIENYHSISSRYVSVNYENVKPNDTITITPALRIFSWDLECLPENTEQFPDSKKPNDIIAQIGITLHTYGTKEFEHHIFTAAKCDNIEEGTVHSYTSEKEMLINFCKFFRKADPDILIGFNTWGFDDKYLWNRLLRHKIDPQFLSRIPEMSPNLDNKKMSSSARGNNDFIFLNCPGRETIDIMVVVQRDFTLDLYTLDHISEHFLGNKKVDLETSELFKKLVGNSSDIAECARYCIKDTILPMDLLNKLNVLSDSMEMAKATFVPISWLLFRGQQCKAFSLISRKARIMGYIIPKLFSSDENFKGATVLEPLIGQYYVPVAGLDFASLYPSIMIAYNICYSTIIESEEMLNFVIENNIPYKEIVITPEKKCYFVQTTDDKGNKLENGVEGILRTILLDLWTGRKETKKLMAKEKDPFLKAMLNGKQLAQKVTMNSIYGFTGASKGILPLKKLAESVTATGRSVIDKTAKIATEEFGGMVIYGDSIPGNELITVNHNDIQIEEFAENIDKEWKEYRGFKIDDESIMTKEYKDTSNLLLYTLTHKGYQRINKVIRHESKNVLYKITALDENTNKIHTVVVTEGHSLIKPDLTTVEAQKLKVNDELYSFSDIPQVINDNNLLNQLYFEICT